jgi:ABC-2 type transport system permease protein
MKPRHIAAVFVARNKEFFRDRAALGWNIVFPVLIVAAFAFVFSGPLPAQYKLGVLGKEAGTQGAGPALLKLKYLDIIPFSSRSAAVRKVKRHQIDMLLDPATHRYWINDTSPKGYFLEQLLQGEPHNAYRKQTVTGRPIRYSDWVVPGVLGVNMMFSALWGIGYVIVRYRKNGVLKRLKATPLSALEFLSAQVLSRMIIILAITAFVFFSTWWLTDFAMFGSVLSLFVVFAVGAFSLVSLGLLVATRTATEELAEGLLNVISWPMMLLSEVWFSLDGLNPVIQKISLAFPLTHLVSAARAIMVDGASLTEVVPQLLVLAAMSVLFLLIGAVSFRWE